MATRAVECGEELKSLVPGEFPCVRRFRYRRLLAFLWVQGYGSAFRAMLNQTYSYFCVLHLEHLVSQGQWTDALNYTTRHFLQVGTSLPPSLEAVVLMKFLSTHHLFHLNVASKVDRDWEPMWAKAAEIVRDLSYRIPEFKGRLLLPDVPMRPQDVLPIGFGFAPFRRRRHVKKHIGRLNPSATAKLYLDKRRRLPSSGHCSQELSLDEFKAKGQKWLARLIGECKLAAKCPELNQVSALQSNPREGTSVTGNVINPEDVLVTLATDADIAGSVIEPKKSLLPSGAAVAPVCHAMYDHQTM